MYVQRTEVVTIAQVAREMTGRNIDILGINETHWTGQGKMQLTEGETIIYSGRDDDNNRGVGRILMSRSAAKALMDWTSISKRITQAWFYSQQIKLTIILCTSMHPQERQTSK